MIPLSAISPFLWPRSRQNRALPCSRARVHAAPRENLLCCSAFNAHRGSRAPWSLVRTAQRRPALVKITPIILSCIPLTSILVFLRKNPHFLLFSASHSQALHMPSKLVAHGLIGNCGPRDGLCVTDFFHEKSASTILDNLTSSPIDAPESGMLH